MKKILTTIFTLTLLSTCLFSVNAKVNTDGETTGTVRVSVIATPVYKVNITWDNLTFTYKFDNWNPETHKYEGDLGWQDKEPRNITLVNHSNKAVTFKARFADDATTSKDVKGVKSILENFEGTLGTAEGTEVLSAPTKKITYKIEGEPTNKNITQEFDVDTITITLK